MRFARLARLVLAGLSCCVLLTAGSLTIAAGGETSSPPDDAVDAVRVEIVEGIPAKESWDFEPPQPVESYTEPAFAFVDVPVKYSPRAIRIDRTNPFLLRATASVALPKGEHQVLVRSRSSARLFMDGKLVVETPFQRSYGSAHEHVRDNAKIKEPHLHPLWPGDEEQVAEISSPGRRHEFRLEVYVGGKKVRPEMGETSVSLRPAGSDGPFYLLSPAARVPLTHEGWPDFIHERRTAMAQLNAANRQKAGADEAKYWSRRHEIAKREILEMPAPVVPEVSETAAVHNEIDRFINRRLEEAGETPAPAIDDWAFLRRASLDITGTIPTPRQIEEFLADRRPGRRARAIDRLLEHPGWADHWVGYWQDVLAENPNIVKPTLNNTGPFRFWIHESFADNKPVDRFATELILMEGSLYTGAPAGFAMAADNDAPMAAKAHVVGQAFLGVQMGCARCHDAPFHDLEQKDLFSLAAMLNRGPQPVPKTSSIPLSKEALSSLIVEVTLEPGSKVEPAWPFKEIAPRELPAGFVRSHDDPREWLAALVTSPRNERFARVIVNRMWRRYMGRGLVEPVDDWEGINPSHPDLLDWLARELVLNRYDLKHVARLILNSHTYQRRPVSEQSIPQDKPHLFAAPLRRRMRAEQLVDSLFVAAGKRLNAGQLNMDLDGSRPYKQFVNLGEPARGWQFASLSNERDRPSLALPFAQDFVTLLTTFGWRPARQNPLTVRETDPTVLQPALLANGVVSRRITRLSDDGALTELALEDQPLERLVERVVVRFLTREPTSDEREMFAELLRDGYESRRIDVDPSEVRRHFPRPAGVSWSNHLSPEANRIKIELEKLAERGDPPSVRLQADWRERMEDMVWALINTPEFVFVP